MPAHRRSRADRPMRAAASRRALMRWLTPGAARARPAERRGPRRTRSSASSDGRRRSRRSSARPAGMPSRRCRGRTLAMLFQKPSLRTRVTFEAGHGPARRARRSTCPRTPSWAPARAVRDVAHNLERFVDAHRGADRSARGRRRARRPGRHPGHQRPDPARAPVPGAGRRVHDPRAPRRAARARSSRSSATATTSTTRSPCSARRSAWRSASPIRPATARTSGSSARAAGARGRNRRPARVRRRPGARSSAAPTIVYTDAWTSMGQEAETEERRDAFAALSGRRRAARRGRPRRHRDALPAGPPRRGDHVGGDGRPAEPDLRPVGEPAPRPEGAARSSCSGDRGRAA